MGLVGGQREEQDRNGNINRNINRNRNRNRNGNSIGQWFRYDMEISYIFASNGHRRSYWSKYHAK